MLSNKLCSILPEEFFLQFLFHFSIFSEVCRAESRKPHHPHSIYIIQLYNSVVFHWEECLNGIRQSSVAFFLTRAQEQYRNFLLRICWEYNSDKVMTGNFFRCSGWLCPTWSCPDFLKVSPASRPPLCIIWDGQFEKRYAPPVNFCS